MLNLRELIRTVSLVPLSSAINLDPTTPVIETDPAKIKSSAYNNPYILRAPGKPLWNIQSC